MPEQFVDRETDRRRGKPERLDTRGGNGNKQRDAEWLRLRHGWR